MISGLENIDLVSLMSEYGIDLVKKGSRFVGHCPFHSEKTPSFFVTKNRFRCFGCQAKGDAITFLMQITGCSFPEALKKMGIGQVDRKISPVDRAALAKLKKKRSLVAAFRRWESLYSAHLGRLLCGGWKKILSISTPEDLDQVGWLYQFLPVWQYKLDILVFGSDQDKYLLFQEVANG
jgi:CHC2 zinc finger